MPATSNKQRVLNLIFSTLSKHMDGKAGTNAKNDPAPVLEQVIYAICREGVTKCMADAAFRSLQDNFFDWNEIRVSSVREIADAISTLPQPEPRAQRIITFLQEVFETTFSFDLESLQKKGLKLASKQLDRYQVTDSYTVSWVIQRSLGGHAIPVDQPTVRVVRRLGLVEPEQNDIECIQSGLEHLVPKAKGPLFTEGVSFLAEEFCHGQDPNCNSCPLSTACAKLLEEELEEVVATATVMNAK